MIVRILMPEVPRDAIFDRFRFRREACHVENGKMLPHIVVEVLVERIDHTIGGDDNVLIVAASAQLGPIKRACHQVAPATPEATVPALLLLIQFDYALLPIDNAELVMHHHLKRRAARWHVGCH